MAKQLGINGPLGDRTTVNGKIRTVLTGLVLMDNLWKMLLTYTTFACNQYTQIG